MFLVAVEREAGTAARRGEHCSLLDIGADGARATARVDGPMDGVVFVLHGERYPLTGGESATLDTFMRVPNLTLRRLRSKMKEAGDVGTDIVITDNEERGALRDSLDLALGDRRHFTDGLQRLREAAREPFARPAKRPRPR
jgi:hypothetical protein